MQTLHHSSYNTPLRMLPECKFRPGIGHGGQRAWYTSFVPLPMSVGLILTRAEGHWYRSTEQMLEDCELLVVNATMFYLDKNPINQDANSMCEFLRAAVLDRPVGEAPDTAGNPEAGAPAVGRRQMLSTVGEVRSASGRQNGAAVGRDADVSRVQVHVKEQQADSGDSDLRDSGQHDRRRTRSNAQPIEADVQFSDRNEHRPMRSAAGTSGVDGEDAGASGRRGARARNLAAEVPRQGQGTRKRVRALADSESEGDWEVDGSMSDESLDEEDDSGGRRKSKASKRSRR